jgi:hypothetical protein
MFVKEHFHHDWEEKTENETKQLLPVTKHAQVQTKKTE